MKYLFILLATFSLTSVIAQTKVTAEDAYKVLKKKPKNVQLLDVRTDKEYESKHIKNSIQVDWNNPTVFESTTSKLNKKKPVYVYCLSGGRSTKAAKVLAEKGYDVREIEGGIMKWESNNLPLISKASTLSGLNKKHFLELTKEHPIVLVDFYATWCGPCKEMEPHINYVKNNYKGKVQVVKIDVDQNNKLIKELKISSIPQLYVYKNGKLTWKKEGYTDLETIKQNL